MDSALFNDPVTYVVAKTAAGLPEIPNVVTLLTRHLFAEHAWSEFVTTWESIGYAIFVGILLSIVFYCASKQKSKIPDGLQNFVEFIV